MDFRRARADEQAAVLALYESVKGLPFCAWDALYPGERELLADLAFGGLYVLVEESQVIGALSVVPKAELKGFACFAVSGEQTRELARIAVSPAWRGRGLARVMLEHILADLRAEGIKAVHISMAKGNLPAWKTYERLGFTVRGQARLYGGDYLLLECIL